MSETSTPNERELRRLRQKLERTETNLRRLEDQREASAVLHASIIQELEDSRRELERKNSQLEALTEQLATSERRATQASRAKSTFLANMSHELRTPLNAIIGYAELLQETLRDEVADLGQRELEQIHHAGRHLLTLINQVLDLSKIEAGRMQLDIDDVSLSDMIRSLVATIGPAVRRKELELRVETCVIGAVRTDGQKLSQILLNLLSNAVKFTERGTVELIVREQGDGIFFSVRDTGIGMTEEQQARVFQPFEQADPSTTRRYGGTGLGLAISERFCALLGGQLAVESVCGEGTRFSFTLPLRTAGAEGGGRPAR